MGNSLNVSLDVATVFGSPSAPVAGSANIASIWKWDAVNRTWAYYSPGLTSAQIAGFTGNQGYQVLTTINPGEGYWVNARNTVTLAPQSGTPFSYSSANFAGLPSSWNLIATASNQSPHAFTNTVSALPPPNSGVNTADTFVSLWAWSAADQVWYYYAPQLDNSGGLPAVKSFANSKGYLHFEDNAKKLDTGTGFWVNKVQ